MKKYLKSFLFLLIALAVAPKIDVKAATYTDVINDGGNWIANNYVVKEKGSIRKYQQMNVITRRSDGHFVYCVQPGTPIEEKPITTPVVPEEGEEIYIPENEEETLGTARVRS